MGELTLLPDGTAFLCNGAQIGMHACHILSLISSCPATALPSHAPNTTVAAARDCTHNLCSQSGSLPNRKQGLLHAVGAVWLAVESQHVTYKQQKLRLNSAVQQC